MQFHVSRLLARTQVAHATLSIRVERPAGFSFHAGQYVDLTVPELVEMDPLGPIRSLSMANAPRSNHLEFIIRVRDTGYKRTLATMPIGNELVLEGPLDDLDFERDPERDHVFIAGGVGIAPFLSLLRGAAAGGDAVPATLFYSNRRPEDAAYLDELADLERRIPDVRMIATMTRMGESTRNWNGETERLGLSLFERFLSHLETRSYYIVGAPGLISTLRRELTAAGVPADSIAVEIYEGY